MILAAILLAAATVPTPAPQPVLPKLPAVAPGYTAPAIPVASPNVIGVTQNAFVGISLENAVGMALSNNPDLAIAQANRRIANYQIVAAQGAFDVRFMVEPQYQYVTQPPQNAFFAGPNFGPIVQRNTSLTTGVQGITQGGQTYSLNASGRQTYDNTSINSFNPYYPTVFSVNFSQPLAKNRGINDASRALQLAQINAQASNEQTLVTTSSTIAQVENTYWDLVSAWRNAAIQEQALRDTITQQNSNVRQARQGTLAPIDVVQANTQIAVFQENLYAALQRVASLQNQLKSLLSDNPNDAIWNANLVPTAAVLQLPQEPALTDLVMTALRNRPEIPQIHAQRAAADVNLQYAENQTKPQVDLQLGYTSNGFAGTPTNPASSPFFASQAQQLMAINQLIAAVNPTLPPSQQIQPIPSSNTPVPSYLSGGLTQSIRNLLNNKFPVYAAGVLVSFPIGDHTAKADLAIAQQQEQVAQIQEANTIQKITVEVRNALQAYQSALSRLQAARTARQAAESVLASEQRRFRAGESTTFLVLQREVELANDRGLELQAQTDLNKAVVELQRATGTILTR
ncbi:MAG TPA: TolC family protein [Candidatus Rubrimentiphilum sp.]|nr:TolC family protein [Candidatus Rubrimentiphilum sp.]